MNEHDKTLLMIRAYDQAVEFVQQLDVQNSVIYSPMVSIEPLNTDKALPKAETVIFTSSNAVRLYADQTAEREQNILSVGSVTAHTASRLGFTILKNFETAAKLVTYLKRDNKSPKDIFYPRAETISVDIAGALSGTVKTITERVIYRQNFQPLSEEGKGTIESLPVIVPILSKEIAFRFLDAIQPLKPRELTIICISNNVGSVFNDLSGFSIKTTPQANRAALMTQIKSCLSTRNT